LALWPAAVWAKSPPGVEDLDGSGVIIYLAVWFGVRVWPLALGIVLGVLALYGVKLSLPRAILAIASGALASLLAGIAAGRLVDAVAFGLLDFSNAALCAFCSSPAAASVMVSLLVLVSGRRHRRASAQSEDDRGPGGPRGGYRTRHLRKLGLAQETAGKGCDEGSSEAAQTNPAGRPRAGGPDSLRSSGPSI
jgi:hypothetical protein